MFIKKMNLRQSLMHNAYVHMPLRYLVTSQFCPSQVKSQVFFFLFKSSDKPFLSKSSRVTSHFCSSQVKSQAIFSKSSRVTSHFCPSQVESQATFVFYKYTVYMIKLLLSDCLEVLFLTCTCTLTKSKFRKMFKCLYFLGTKYFQSCKISGLVTWQWPCCLVNLILKFKPC